MSLVVLYIKGPEPEALEVGMFGEHQLVFVGAERPGFVAVYRMTSDAATGAAQLTFESLFYAGGRNKTWSELYQARETNIVEPEDMR